MGDTANFIFILGLSLLLAIPMIIFWIVGIRFFWKRDQKAWAAIVLLLGPLVGFFIGAAVLMYSFFRPTVRPTPVAPVPSGAHDSSGVMELLAQGLAAHGFTVERNKSLPGTGLQADLYARRTFWTLFIPNKVYLFIYDWEESLRGEGRNVLEVHRSARELVDRLSTLPKMLRVAPPAIVTTIVSEGVLPRDVQVHVAEQTADSVSDRLVGGEVHSVLHIDLHEPEVAFLKRVFAQGAAPLVRTKDVLQEIYNTRFKSSEI